MTADEGASTKVIQRQPSDGYWHVHDTKLLVRWLDVTPNVTSESSKAHFDRILKILGKLGFKITADPEVKKRFRSISPNYRYGRHRDLQLTTQIYPAGAEFHFYQDVQREHARSGRYDFDQRKRMPYLIGKSFELAVRAIETYLASQGFEKRERVTSAVPNPLAFFNDHWDSDFDRARGQHRFRRGPDGWPADSEINSWDRKDADGATLSHGDVRHFRCHKGYLRKGRVYGGINGRWLVIYGRGSQDFTHVSSFELFTAPPGTSRRDVGTRRRDARLKKELDKANAAKDVQRAATLLSIIKRLADREAVPLAA